MKIPEAVGSSFRLASLRVGLILTMTLQMPSLNIGLHMKTSQFL
jgi:hypothetical protein